MRSIFGIDLLFRLIWPLTRPCRLCSLMVTRGVVVGLVEAELSTLVGVSKASTLVGVSRASTPVGVSRVSRAGVSKVEGSKGVEALQISEAGVLLMGEVAMAGVVVEVGTMRGLMMGLLPTLHLLASLNRKLAMLLQSQLVPLGAWQV